jgi:hypothetical protein
MIAKVLAGVLAFVVLTVGGYAYWQYTGDCGCGTESVSQSTSAPVPPCCQEPSRSDCGLSLAVPCCESESGAEVLTIAPREVK